MSGSNPPAAASPAADDGITAALATAKRIRSQVLDELKLDFVGKDEVIDLLGVCLAAGENLFLLGPPGTAKSAIVRALAARLEGRCFDYLLTRFTEPAELFGPFDIRRLREGELVTNTEGMLPEADILFLDELLNANSAILNSLLMALNERVFRRGRESRDLNFVLAVGASNRLPEDEALGALFDRFLLRVRSDNVPTDQLNSVLTAGWKLQQQEAVGWTAPRSVSVAEIRQLQKTIPRIDISPIRTEYVSLIRRMRNAGIDVSDRRAVRLQRLIAAGALLCGRQTVDCSDLWVLKYIWDTAEQVEVLAGIVNEAIDAESSARTIADTQRHPRSRAADLPDPDAIARSLDRLISDWGEAADDSLRRSWIRDQASLLAGRIDWVESVASRDFLRQRLQQLSDNFNTTADRFGSDPSGES
ncbi:MAG: AAA family ATPase [Planctomycetaceae bacterium]|nr:AAA family ATPase [Planctomycetaceae bacterium]